MGLAAIGLLALVLYWPALDHPFVYDDVRQIAGNPRVNSWAGLVAGFDQSVWGFDAAKGHDYYRPIFLSVLTAAQMLSSGEPWALHAASLLLHLLNVLLVWRLGARLGAAPWAGLLACALFALHPVQIQAVVWASAISDPLMATFGLAALLAMLRWQAGGRRLDQLAAAFLFALACLTLERAFAFALPLLLVGLYRPEGQAGRWSWPTRGRAATDALAVFLPVVLALVLRASASERGAGGLEPDVTGTLLTIPGVVVRYLVNLAAPMQLALAYPEQMLDEASGVGFALPLVVCLAVAACLLLPSRGHPRRQLLIACLASSLAPPLAVGLLPGYALVQDRYLYLPSVFLFLWLGDVVVARLADARTPALRAGVGFALALWLLGLLALHPANRRPWQSEIALYERAVTSAPGNAHFLMNLSNALARGGAPDAGCGLLVRATDALAEDSRLGDAGLAWFNLGNCLRRRGELEPALDAYETALRHTDGELPQAWENAAVTLLDLARDDEALAHASVLRERWPGSASGFKLAGIVHARRGELDLAWAELQHAHALAPNDSAIRGLLARVAVDRRARQEAGGP